MFVKTATSCQHPIVYHPFSMLNEIYFAVKKLLSAYLSKPTGDAVSKNGELNLRS